MNVSFLRKNHFTKISKIHFKQLSDLKMSHPANRVNIFHSALLISEEKKIFETTQLPPSSASQLIKENNEEIFVKKLRWLDTFVLMILETELVAPPGFDSVFKMKT